MGVDKDRDEEYSVLPADPAGIMRNALSSLTTFSSHTL